MLYAQMYLGAHESVWKTMTNAAWRQRAELGMCVVIMSFSTSETMQCDLKVDFPSTL